MRFNKITFLVFLASLLLSGAAGTLHAQNYVFRHPEPEIQKLIGDLAEEAAKNNLIGYDQNQRTQGDFGSDIYIVEEV